VEAGASLSAVNKQVIKHSVKLIHKNIEIFGKQYMRITHLCVILSILSSVLLSTVLIIGYYIWNTNNLIPAGNPSKYVSAENLYIKIKNLLFPLKSLKTYFLKARLSL
jgi:hypothetical protein